MIHIQMRVPVSRILSWPTHITTHGTPLAPLLALAMC